MKNRFFVFLLCISLIISSCLPAYATEGISSFEDESVIADPSIQENSDNEINVSNVSSVEPVISESIDESTLEFTAPVSLSDGTSGVVCEIAEKADEGEEPDTGEGEDPDTGEGEDSNTGEPEEPDAGEVEGPNAVNDGEAEGEAAEEVPLENVIYFDLYAGNVVINGNTYTGYRFDGQSTAQKITGTLQAGESYYVYQSNEENKLTTGLISNEDGTKRLVLPEYERVEGWAEFITNNTDIDSETGVIATWDTRAKAAGRSAANPEHTITVSGNLTASMVIDNVWSGYQQPYGSTETSGAIKYDPTGSAKLTLIFKGDNRFATIYYYATKAQKAEIIFAGDADSTVTVANLKRNTNNNYWKSAIGADDGKGEASGIVINSGYIFAGTNAGDDCTAIGGGGNGYGGVTINGGTVTAVATSSGAAIGGGIGKSSTGGQATVTINDGTVYAYNFSCTSGKYSEENVAYIPAAAIGGGSSAKATCNECTVTINGGYVFARSVGGTAIGGGSSADTHGGSATVNINGGIIDAASIAGTIGGQPVKAGAAIGGGTGGAKGNGGDCTLTISGNPIIYTGSIGGGKTINTTGANKIGAATVNISGGKLQGQIVMAKGADKSCSFTMTGGTIDNTFALSGTLNEEQDLEFSRIRNSGEAIQTTNYANASYNTYTYLEKNGTAVYMDDPKGVSRVSGGTILNCRAENGGAVYMTAGSFEMSGTAIVQDCAATVSGGAVYIGSDGENKGIFNMTGGTITKCSAAVDGGAVYLSGGTATVDGGTITECSAAIDGGAVYVNGGSAEFSGGIIENNSAEKDGGAFYITGGDLLVSGTAKISDCSASQNGGGFFISQGNMTINNGYISKCSASADGGAAYVTGGTVSIGHPDCTGFDSDSHARSTITQNTHTHPIITENTAVNGAAIAVTVSNSNDTVRMYCGSLINNHAQDKGGAVFLSGGSFIVDSGEISNNLADKYGGAVFLSAGNIIVGRENCDGINDTHKHPETLHNFAQVGGGYYVAGSGLVYLHCGPIQNNSANHDSLGDNIYMEGGNLTLNIGTVVGEVIEDEDRNPGIIILDGELIDKTVIDNEDVLIYYHRGTEVEEESTALAKYYQYFNLPTNEDERLNWTSPYPGRVFVGWANQDKVENIHSEQDYWSAGEAISLTTKSGVIENNSQYEIHLYAVWVNPESQISYFESLDGVSCNMMENDHESSTSYSYTFDEQVINLVAPHKEGYILKEWRMAAGFPPNNNWNCYEINTEVDITESSINLDVSDWTVIEEDALNARQRFGELFIVAVYEPAYADLHVTTEGVQNNQTLLFEISGTPYNSEVTFSPLTIILKGNDTVILKNIPVGEYIVKEHSGKWSWRYAEPGFIHSTNNPESNFTVKLDSSTVSKDEGLCFETVTFDFSPIKYLYNWFSYSTYFEF